LVVCGGSQELAAGSWKLEARNYFKLQKDWAGHLIPEPMPASRVRCHAAALLGYVFVAAAFTWPLPLHMGSALLGPPSGDTGVYVWNLWVFRHEIVAHHQLPFFTREIFSLGTAVPLTLHNYTSLANILAFPLLPILGTVATFNLLTIASGAISAYAMFVVARRMTGDAVAAWVAGLAFGFAPFMSARAMAHFSLLQTAPLPLFALLLERLHAGPTRRLAAAAGVAVACAFLCDPYYAVYCLLIGGFAVAYSAVVIQPGAMPARPYLGRALLDIALVCLAGLIAGMIVRGGGRFEVFGIRVSMIRLYTPMLVFTVLAVARLWLAIRARVSLVFPTMLPPVRVLGMAGLACVVLLTPVLSALLGAAGESEWGNPRVLWRSSPGGLDLFALFVPNPLNPWFGRFFVEGARQMPGGFVENVGSIPWVLIAVLLIAAGFAGRLPRYWLAFTAFFGLLALGPFVRIAGQMTYVPTPWALLRYLPVIGAARMPTRMMALVMLGLAMLLAFALRDLRRRVRWPAALSAAVAAALLLEMLPAPRELYSAAVPSVNRIIAADPRPLRVMNLPFGLRDGLSSYGNTDATGQFNQTVHEKQLIGGYISRLRNRDVVEYRRMRVTSALIDLSEGQELSEERRQNVINRAHVIMPALNLGYVVVNTDTASEDLIEFARAAFDLTPVASDGPFVLYRTPLASPLPGR
jgi:hypothetical protein